MKPFAAHGAEMVTRCRGTPAKRPRGAEHARSAGAQGHQGRPWRGRLEDVQRRRVRQHLPRARHPVSGLHLRHGQGRRAHLRVRLAGRPPRHCKNFKPKPGEKFKWASTSLKNDQVQSGKATADRSVLVTLRGVQVDKGKNRIVISAR